MTEEITLAINKYKEAVDRLHEGIQKANSDLERDGVIQRFEFTFELLWKALRIYLEDQGRECKSPKDCLKQAFRYGLITDEQLFLGMLEDRNKTSHIYNRAKGEEIFQNIKGKYYPAMSQLVDILKGGN